MSTRPSTNPSAPVFRIDKFVVPTDALSAFIEQVQRTQQTLGVLPGCRQNLVMTQTGGPGEFNVVTLVEWVNTQAIAAATAAMQKKYAEEGFDPSAFMQTLGVRADLGLYSKA